MKAKDTTLKPSELLPVLNGKPLTPPFYIGIKQILEAQAEISFKAGYEKCGEELEVYLLKWKKAGIREVVEWVMIDNHKRIEVGSNKHLGWAVNSRDWQAKLKDWGINEADKNKAHKC